MKKIKKYRCLKCKKTWTTVKKHVEKCPYCRSREIQKD